MATTQLPSGGTFTTGDYTARMRRVVENGVPVTAVLCFVDADQPSPAPRSRAPDSLTTSVDCAVIR